MRNPTEAVGAAGSAAARSSVVRLVPAVETDEALVRALLEGRPGAADLLFQRYAQLVRKVLVRVLNTDPEMSDLVHEVFVSALSGIHRLKNPALLKSWITSITVFKARELIRRRRRGRWLHFVSNEELDTAESSSGDPEVLDAVRSTYRILDSLPEDERMAFALRFIDGMDLPEIASACRVSVPTIKRRLRRAQERFVNKARSSPTLWARVEHGGRWTP